MKLNELVELNYKNKMISFIPDTELILPYDRAYYIDFLDDDNFSSNWQGISFQLYADKECSFTEFLNAYNPLIKTIVLKFGRNASWIVNHDDKDMPWFPTNNKNLANLRSLFRKYKIPGTFKGYLTFTGNDLLDYAQDLISYPYLVFEEEDVLYKNLDISHSKLPFIIKISGHLTIDFISTDKSLLRKLANEYSKTFIIKQYWGSDIWE